MRRRFFAICEKPEGADNRPPPPGRARVKINVGNIIPYFFFVLRFFLLLFFAEYDTPYCTSHLALASTIENRTLQNRNQTRPAPSPGDGVPACADYR